MTDNGVTFDVGFLVQGSVGAQTITMTLGRRITSGTDRGKFMAGPYTTTGETKFIMIYTPDDATDKMVIRLFDQKYSADYLFIDDISTSTKTDYTFAMPDDSYNVLCINTSSTSFTGEYVLTTPKSTVVSDSYKLSFSGDYYVAHITSSDSYSLTLACKDDCPDLSIGTTPDQWGNISTPAGIFDPGDYSTAGVSTSSDDRWSSSGTCNTTRGNGILFKRSGANLPTSSKYTVIAQLYVNGTEASSSTVKWTAGFGNTATYRGNSSTSGKCATAATAWTAGGVNQPWSTYKGSTGPTMISQVIITDSVVHDAFMIDLPTIDYTHTNLTAGDQIQVKVKIGKYPCDEGTEETLCLANVVYSCPSTASYQLTFPFATNKDNGSYWTGIAVVNLSSSDSTLTFKLYDSAGGSGSLSNVSVIGRGQYLNTIGGIIDTSGFTNGATALDTTKDVVVEVTGDRALDGICFVGSTNNNQLHGYLPRVWKDSAIQH
jgi:hypothetical protein